MVTSFSCIFTDFCRHLCDIKILVIIECKHSIYTNSSHLGKGMAIPVHAWTDPQDSRRLRLSDIKMVRFSALRSGRLYPPGNIPGTHLC